MENKRSYYLNKIKQPIVRESLRFYKFFENLEFIYLQTFLQEVELIQFSILLCCWKLYNEFKNLRFDKYKLAENSYQMKQN